MAVGTVFWVPYPLTWLEHPEEIKESTYRSIWALARRKRVRYRYVMRMVA